ncbi:MAG: helix-turn-helix transcriptional regulator [Lachnospiraceae bacterium]|nr:helix-turn-helix transcriptional regulator [Lachnospiraceae bacterium]
MFNENLKTLRKQKGFTQEELAIRVSVVRQTVSKWEKGLSVPDADALQRIADVLDVGVNELLGADFTQNADNNEVAQQLARINEQLAIKNRRWNLFWKIVGIILLLNVVLAILGFVLFGAITSSMTTEVGEAEEMMMDEEYIEE